ncbi:hypothetical protein HU200_032242 [Digitaria exilis]|uniref:DUF1618 domain-containing protein n=1 Tax=Digitaria exilis TaxID=1010633 RepID=A0A835EP68_9POAL|nr:hypothetical protein HU200_032242 [Digitaria exilis]
MSAAEGVPKWILLEPVVFRRDDVESFPDTTEAPIRASGTTSWGAHFRIAFSLAEPPSISRLYAHLPGFPHPYEAEPLRLLATHRYLALLRVGTTTPTEGAARDFFIFKAEKNRPSSCLLTALPPCTEPPLEFHSVRPRRRQPSDVTPRQLDPLSLGLWCGDEEEEEDEFVVAELALYVRTQGLRCLGAQANICFLRSSFAGDQLGPHKWDTACLPLVSTTNEDLLKLFHWQTDAAVPFQRWLCWIDYHRGILFWDVSKKVPALAVSFVWFPEDSYSLATYLKTPCSGNGGVSVVDNGRVLKFAYVARHDSLLAFEPLKPGTGFTITCHTLLLGNNNGSMKWEKDYTVTSDDLPDYLQRGGIPVFPRVDVDRPHLVHCIFSEFGKAYNRMSVLSIDMSTKSVESFYLYMDANVFFQTD